MKTRISLFCFSVFTLFTAAANAQHVELQRQSVVDKDSLMGVFSANIIEMGLFTIIAVSGGFLLVYLCGCLRAAHLEKALGVRPNNVELKQPANLRRSGPIFSMPRVNLDFDPLSGILLGKAVPVPVKGDKEIIKDRFEQDDVNEPKSTRE